MKRIFIIGLLMPFVQVALGIVVVYPTGLTITGYEGPMEEGSTLQLQAVPTPANTSYNNYSWSSDNASVATVSSTGLVTAVSEGTATIKCSLSMGNTQYFMDPYQQTATCVITVQKTTPTVQVINFADAEVKRICVENWDTDGDGELSYDEAAAVTAIGTVFKGNSVITTFNELAYFTGLISIAGGAFRSDVNLKSIVIPDGLRFIESEAFRDCRSLESITIPESVVKIGGFAFCDCFSIPSLYIPKNVSSIGSGVTSADGKAFASIVVDSDNPYYDSRDNCNAIIETATNTLIADGKNTVIPTSVTSLGDWVFYDRPDTEIVIPQQITSIGQGAFGGCSNLERLTLPSSITSISNEAFRYARKLNEVRVYMKSPVAITDRVFFEVELGNVTLYVPNGSKAAYQAADNWKNFKEIIEMDIEGSDAIEFADAEVKRICVENWDTNGDGELSYDEAAAVNNLGQVFRNNKVITSFEELQYFTGLTSIANYAFANASSLVHVVIPEGVKYIEADAFNTCTSLHSIFIPKNVTSIGSSSFVGCTGVASISVDPENTVFESPNNCNAIVRKTDLTLLTGCKNTVIPENVKCIGMYAFQHSLIENVVIPDSVTSINYMSFDDCKELVSVSLPEGITTIGAWAFNANKKLQQITLPKNLCTIGIYAFQGCQSLNTVEISEGISIISDGMFALCSALTSIVIPASVTSIGNSAFYECSRLTEVTILNSEPCEITSMYTFTNRTNATLYVPKGSKAAYMAADYWKDFKEIVELEEDEPEEPGGTVEVTDITQMANAVYMVPVSAPIGNDVKVEICLKNAQAATAYVFELVLPEGVTVAKDSYGRYLDALSDRHDDHSRTFNDTGNNTYKLSALSGNSEELTGNDGAIRLLTLHVADDMAEGTYAIMIKNAQYSTPNGVPVMMENTVSTITVENYILGDVNGNEEIDIADAVCVVNHLVEKPVSTFVTKAADANKNGSIDIGDAVTIVNYLMGETVELSRQTNMRFDAPNPLALYARGSAPTADMLSVDNIVLPQNGEADVVVRFYLGEGSTCSGTTFWLQVSEALVFDTYERNGNASVAYTAGDSYDDTPTIATNIDDGYLKVGCITSDSDPLNKQEGTLMTFRIRPVGIMDVGTVLHGTLTHGSISAEDGSVHGVADATFTVTIGKPDDMATGISDSHRATMADDRVYDLQGRPYHSELNKKGLYIRNGKKEIVR